MFENLTYEKLNMLMIASAIVAILFLGIGCYFIARSNKAESRGKVDSLELTAICFFLLCLCSGSVTAYSFLERGATEYQYLEVTSVTSGLDENEENIYTIVTSEGETFAAFENDL